VFFLFQAAYVFFFQEEDGIRDFHVTGVQTCALPILKIIKDDKVIFYKQEKAKEEIIDITKVTINEIIEEIEKIPIEELDFIRERSEERRVGKAEKRRVRREDKKNKERENKKKDRQDK